MTSSDVDRQPDEQDRAEKRSVLIAAVLGAFLTPFTASSVNVALPDLQADFHLDAVVLTWIATAYLLATAVFLVPFGRAADMIGRKRTFVAGLGIFTGASFVAGVAPGIWILMIARVLQGFGSALMFATNLAIVSSVFSPRERGRAIGIVVASVYIGLSVGPFLGGILTEYGTWRSVFVATVPMGALATWVAARYIKQEWAESRGESFDWIGAALYGSSISLIMLGLSGMPEIFNLAELVVGLALMAGFIRWEFAAKSPVFTIELFSRNRVFAFSSAAALINYSATFAVTFILSLYLQYNKGLSPQTAGLVLVAQPMMMAMFSPFAGRLSDRTEPRKVASVGMGICALGLAFFAGLGSGSPIWYVVAVLMLLGLGFGLFSSPNMNAIMTSVDKQHYGLAAATVGSMRLLGQMFSMGVTAVVFSVMLGRVEITPDLYPQFVDAVRVAFVVFCILCIIGIGASLARGTINR